MGRILAINKDPYLFGRKAFSLFSLTRPTTFTPAAPPVISYLLIDGYRILIDGQPVRMS